MTTGGGVERCDTAPFFELSIDMLCLANLDGYFLRVNPAFMETLGWSEQVLLGRRFLDFVHPEDLEATLREVAHLADGQRSIDFENRYRCADGSWRWLSWRAAVDPHSKLIYAVARDVTGLKRARLEAEQAREVAEQASRSKSTFLANMSHELRTPLNAIIGYSEMLKEDFEARRDEGDAAAVQVVQDLERIRAAGRHLLGLINQVLDLSKIEAGKLEALAEDFDVAELVEGVRAVVAPLARAHGNRLEVLVAPDVGAMRSDLTMIRQILINLASNAARFTRDGRVELRASAEGADQVCLEVVDSGIGIEAEDLDRIFEPFTQADPSTTRRHGGTGLGLSISRHFCGLLGGSIGVESAPGRGSRFWVRLPRRLAGQEGAGAQEPDLEGEPSQPADVLIIDDDPLACDLAERVLAQLGLRAGVAHSGAQGLAMARRRPPRLVLLDVLMPGMDGWAVLDALRKDPALREVPVVLTSVLDEGELGFALGVAGHLSKPIDPGDLSAILARHELRPDIPEALVVDDDEGARELVVRALHRAGWRAREARDGEEGLAALRQARPDLVLLDLAMPRMDGFELLRRVRQDAALDELPVVVVTGRSLSERELALLKAGARRVLAKGPRLADELRSALRAWVPADGRGA
ncbi:response regulator [Myxococcota bacterium]|nr:response regulator [Myxococcota bacterium]